MNSKNGLSKLLGVTQGKGMLRLLNLILARAPRLAFRDPQKSIRDRCCVKSRSVQQLLQGPRLHTTHAMGAASYAICET